MLDYTIFKFKYVYIYTSTSKQNVPFVSKAKEGYLSTPHMLYSCMYILGLLLMKSVTKVVPSYDIPGLNITAHFMPYNHAF